MIASVGVKRDLDLPCDPSACQFVSEERERFEVLLEEVRGQFGVVADGHRSLNEKFDRLEGKVDLLAEDMSLVKMDVNVLKVRVGKIEHHLGLNGTGPTPRRKPTRVVAMNTSPKRSTTPSTSDSTGQGEQGAGPQSSGQEKQFSKESQEPSPQVGAHGHSLGQVMQLSSQSHIPLPQTGGQSAGQLQLSSTKGSHVPLPQ